jgi:ribose 5-phosphate isomerase B
MKIAIGSDHAGYSLKEELKKVLEKEGFEVIDMGTEGEESVDYPDYAREVAQLISKGKVKKGLLICGTGLGMAIVANKHRGVRATPCADILSARLAREHNDSNVLCLGSRLIASYHAQEILKTWLYTSFSGGRHERRINKIARIEEESL